MAITANNLRFRVRLEKKVSVASDYGGATSEWVEQAERAADIRPMKGGEGVQAQRLVGTQPVLIIVRFDVITKQIAADWRAVELMNGTPVRYYALKTAEDMERERRFITMIAVAGDPDGGDGPPII
jgi:SPP1 family predicted phage head-tail adaptor